MKRARAQRKSFFLPAVGSEPEAVAEAPGVVAVVSSVDRLRAQEGGVLLVALLARSEHHPAHSECVEVYGSDILWEPELEAPNLSILMK